MDYPFLCGFGPHTITLRAPALYAAIETRELISCDSSGGECHNQNLFRLRERAVLVTFPFLPHNIQKIKHHTASRGCHHDCLTEASQLPIEPMQYPCLILQRYRTSHFRERNALARTLQG